MRVTVKAINDELKSLGHDAELAKGDGYFYFTSGETADWLDRTVKVRTLSSLTLEQWVREFGKLKQVNRDFLGGTDRVEPDEKKTTGRKRTRKA